MLIVFTAWACRLTTLQQGIPNHTNNEVMHQTRFMKAHLMLGRMHIHIDLRRIQLQIENIGGSTLHPQRLQIPLSDGMGE